MVHFACMCLNVRIHSRPDPRPLKDVNNIYTSDELFLDPFFTPETLVVTMDLCGITKSQELFCKDRVVDGWTVVTCSCCMIDICASRVDEIIRVLVNNNAETGDHIDFVEKSPQYSRLFKLVLPEINESFIQNNVGLELMHRNLDNSVEYVQRRVSNHLASEQKRMEESIRKFIEAQHNAYADLLQSTRKQKQAMIYLLLKSKEKEIPSVKNIVSSPSIESSAAAVTKEIKNGSSTSADSVFDKNDIAPESLYQEIRVPAAKNLRRTKSHNLERPKKLNKPKTGPRRPPVNIDVGGIFDMEEFDSREEYSEGDSGGSDCSDADQSKYKKDGADVMFTNSLPMSIPAFPRPRNYSVVEDDDDEDDYKKPDDIAASIRALACSVTDGTEMFGELPRRRLNTGDLVAIRH